MTSIQELFGQAVNPIDNLANVLPTSFTNLWDATGIGQSIFAPIGQVTTTGGVGCPDGTVDPVSTINYLMNKREVIERAAYQRPMFRIGDKNLNVICEMTGEMAADFEELMCDTGSARYVVNWENWVVDYLVNLTAIEEDLHLLIDPIPSAPDWRSRWGGKIHLINVERHEDGTSTVELQAVSMREHAKRLLIAANPFFMPEVQLPKMWMLPGPIRTVLFITFFVNLARLFLPGLSFITNILNPLSWINPINADSLLQTNPLDWPIQIAFVNPAIDVSSWTVLGATWTSWHDATTDLLKNAGCMLQAHTWLTTDFDSPYDELVNLIDLTVDLGMTLVDEAVSDITLGLVNLSGVTNQIIKQTQSAANSIARPTRNCVIFKLYDKSGQTGPTGTPIDGLLNVIGVTLDDLFSSVLINADTGLTLDGQPVYDVNGNEFPIVESLLGVAPEVPKVIWREGQFTGIINAKHSLHKGSPRTAMTGGRSPSLVNQTQTFLIKYGLSQLSDLIGESITASQIPGTPGLDSLYQNQLDNSLLAWERITNPTVLAWGGDVDYQEVFERGSAVAYTLSSVITLQTALWKNRDFQGIKVKVMPGKPWVIYVDTVLGDRNGFEFSGVIYVDQIYGIKQILANDRAYVPELTIGEDKDQANPMMLALGSLQAMYTMFGAFLGEGTLFG